MKALASDRKGNKKTPNDELVQSLTFTLPESLPTSEVAFPVLVSKTTGANWNKIVAESDKEIEEILQYSGSKIEEIPKSPFINTECEYLEKEVFVHLLPAVEATLKKAKIWNAFVNHKCFFNGIDHIAQVLWNSNPRYTERKEQNQHIFNMPWVREELKANPRPYYPKSWLWPEDYAAKVIQKFVRQYFVQKTDDVQEMREFWRKLELEKLNPEYIKSNPLLAKKWASNRDFHSS